MKDVPLTKENYKVLKNLKEMNIVPVNSFNTKEVISMAKLFKVYCNEFSIGFGPKILKIRKHLLKSNTIESTLS